jgi:hypothetical protein
MKQLALSWMRWLPWSPVPFLRLGLEVSACRREPVVNEVNVRTETPTTPVGEMPVPTTADPSSTCPPALVRLAQRVIAESNARMSRLSRLRDRLASDDGARQQLHEETLLLLSQVQHVQHIFASFNVEFAVRTKENEAALFNVEPVLVIGDAPIPPDGTTLEPAAVVNGEVVFRGRCIRHVRRVA